ncbi:MAG: radical SAM protein [Deltaproteobacteria bacterium]|nr:radical SAM protein [Deltaproteobacteria bacterium]
MTQTRFVLRLERDFGLLYDRQRHEYTRLSDPETFLLAGVDRMGFVSCEAALVSTYGVERASSVIESTRSAGLLGSDGSFDGRVVEVPSSNGTFGAPLAAHIGLTTACNFACRHCYSRSGPKSPNELTRAEIEGILDELAAMGCQQLVFGGGEPFLRKDLPQLVARAGALGLDSYVHTNATLITKNMLTALSAWPPTGLTISLDGSRPDVNDRVRGDGTFSSTIEAMRMVRSEYTPGFAISMTVTSANHFDTVEMVELAKREGASLLLLRPPFPAGNLLDSRALMVDLPTFWAAVGVAKRRGAEIGLAVNSPEEGGAVLPTDFDGFGCIAGHVVLGITPTGDVTPCLNLPDSYVGGNIRSSSVLEIWHSGSSFTELRAVQPNEDCASCEHYEVCRGGCRIRAIDAGNGVSGRDTWCYKEVGRGVTAFGSHGSAAELRAIGARLPSKLPILA